MSAVSSVQSYSVKLNDDDKERIIRKIHPLSSWADNPVDSVIASVRETSIWQFCNSEPFARNFLTPFYLGLFRSCNFLSRSEFELIRSLVDAVFIRTIENNKSLYSLRKDFNCEYLNFWVSQDRFGYLFRILARFAQRLREHKLDCAPLTKQDIKHIKLPATLKKGKAPGATRTAIIIQQLVQTGLLVETSSPDKEYRFQNPYILNVFGVMQVYAEDQSDKWLDELNTVDAVLANELFICNFLAYLKHLALAREIEIAKTRMQKCLHHIERVFKEGHPLTYARLTAEEQTYSKEALSFLKDKEKTAPRYALLMLKCKNECTAYELQAFWEIMCKVFYAYALHEFDGTQCQQEGAFAFTRLRMLGVFGYFEFPICRMLESKNTRLVGLKIIRQFDNIEYRMGHPASSLSAALARLSRETDDLEVHLLITQIMSQHLERLIQHQCFDALKSDQVLFELIRDEKAKLIIRQNLTEAIKNTRYSAESFEILKPTT